MAREHKCKYLCLYIVETIATGQLLDPASHSGLTNAPVLIEMDRCLSVTLKILSDGDQLEREDDTYVYVRD